MDAANLPLRPNNSPSQEFIAQIDNLKDNYTLAHAIQTPADERIVGYLQKIVKGILNVHSIDLHAPGVCTDDYVTKLCAGLKVAQTLYYSPGSLQQYNQLTDMKLFQFDPRIVELGEDVNIFTNLLIVVNDFNIPTSFTIKQDLHENMKSRVTLYYNDEKLFYTKYERGNMYRRYKSIIEQSLKFEVPTQDIEGCRYTTVGTFYILHALVVNNQNILLKITSASTKLSSFENIREELPQDLPPYIRNIKSFSVSAGPEGFDYFTLTDINSLTPYTVENYNQLKANAKSEEELNRENKELFSKDDDEVEEHSISLFHSILLTVVRSYDCVFSYGRHTISMQWLKNHEHESAIIHDIIQRILIRKEDLPEPGEDGSINMIFPCIPIRAYEIEEIIRIGNFDRAQAKRHVILLHNRMLYPATIEELQ